MIERTIYGLFVGGFLAWLYYGASRTLPGIFEITVATLIIVFLAKIAKVVS